VSAIGGILTWSAMALEAINGGGDMVDFARFSTFEV